MKPHKMKFLIIALTTISPLAWEVGGAAAKYNMQVQLGSTAARSLMVETGQTVRILASSTEIAKVKAAKFQWLKNDMPMEGETNDALTLTNVDISHVGSYSVHVSSPHNRAESAAVHVSVYSLFTNYSNGGTLTAPIGDFTISGNTTLPCGGTFDRFRAYVPFDGPNRIPKSTTFPNDSQAANLDITTCTNINGSIDTGIRIQENWLPMNPKDCNDNTACGVNALASSCTATNLQTNKTYRATIYFKSSTLDPTNTTVSFRWYYHN
jgi:hypothetical protein